MGGTHENPTRSAQVDVVQVAYANSEKGGEGDDIFLLSCRTSTSHVFFALSLSLAIAILIPPHRCVVAIGSPRARTHNGDGA
jgi:hypothetical protein